MKNTIDAKYYDGQSSVSLQATVTFKNVQFERYGHILELRNTNYSDAILKIDDKYFSDKLYSAMKKNKNIDIHTQLLNLGLSKITVIAFCLLGLITLAYFYVLPPIAEKSATLLPESFDNEIGNLFMDAFLSENNIDTTKTKHLKQFAAELDLKNRKPLRFTVVKSKEVNAFALPNGQIVVFSAILENMESFEELVALLGHEASHVNYRHSIKMLCRNLAGYMTVSLIFSDVNGVMTILADNAQQLHSLSYSRSFEQEADEQGLEILMNNNVDPNGMVKLFEQLEKESEIYIPKIISSHPLAKERKDNMQKIISETVYEIKPNDKLNSIFEYIKN
jgi:predicted Zn-dependent protease